MWISASSARADDRVRVYVDGECPSDAGLGAALQAEVVEVSTSAAPWTIKVESSSGTSRLTVLHVEDGSVAERSIASDDCAAVAEAFALIIKGLVSMPRAPPAPPNRARQSSGGATAAIHTTAPGSIAADAADDVIGLAPRARPRFSVAATGGVDLRFDDTRARLVGFDIAFPIRRTADVRVIVEISEEVTSVGELAELDRRQSALRAEIGTRGARGPLWLEVGAGGGVTLSSVNAPSSTGSIGVVRVHPVFTSTLAIGARVSGSVSLRAHLGAALFPVVDRYTTAIMGEIGQSPRASVGFGVGLQFDVGK